MLEANFRVALKKKLDVLSASESVEVLLGYKPQEFLSSRVSLEKMIHPDDADAARILFSPKANDPGGTVNLRIRHADGRIRCMRGCYRREFAAKGDPILNLTLRNVASCLEDQPHQASDVNLRAVMDSLDEAVYFKDRNHVIAAANQSFCRMFPDSAGEPRNLAGLTDYELYSEYYADRSYRLEKQVFAGEPLVRVVEEIVGRQGEKIWQDNRKFPVRDREGQIIGVFTTIAAVSEGAMAERAIRDVEESLKEVQKIAGVGSFVVDLQTESWSASDISYEILGIDRGCERTLAHWTHLIHPDDFARLEPVFGEFVKDKERMLDLETRFIRQTDRSLRWAHVRGRLELNAEGSPQTLRGTIQDISRRKLVEGELMESTGLLQRFIQDAPTGLAMFDREMRYISASQRWLEDHDIEDLDFVGRCHYDIISTIPERWKGQHRRAMEGETISFREDSYPKEDGSVRWVRRTVRPWWTGDGAVGGIVVLSEDITERKLAEGALNESREQLQLFIEHAPAALAMFDQQMRYISASRRWIEDYSLLGQDIIGRSHYEIFPHIPERWREAHRRGLAGDRFRVEEDRFERADGTVNWLRWEMIPWRTGDGRIGGIILFSEDITKQKAGEERLHLAASVFAHASEGILITDVEGAILDVNEAFTRITGYAREEVLGRNPRMLNSGRQTREFYSEMWTQLKEKGHWSGEIWNRAKSGQIFAEILTISAVPDAKGNTKQFVAMFSDITSLKEQERRLEHIAHYDLLTGLPNRVLLADRLHQAMAQAHRSKRLVAIACLDLDNFREVNDHHGHNKGDQLLVAITHRMTLALREGDTLARLGGDELVAVMLDLTSVDEGHSLITGLLESAAEPVQLGDLDVQVSASIGVTFFPQADDVDADQLLRQADQAMYHAKLSGKGRYHIFDPTLDRSLRGHHEDLQRIRSALAANEFELYYQPKVNMCTGTILSAEALIRWNHPEHGLMLPGQFLPILEGNPLAIELGEWVIDSALKQVELWRGEGLDIPVSVNVDAQQLQQPGFVDRLSELLARHPSISPFMLELEVLESSALQDVNQVSQVIRDCSMLGISFAIDDFGTGYSSLSYLKRLPVHFLKIDRTFVHDMLDDPEDLTILEGVLGLANAFRREAVAEGVETVEHGLMLLRLGCQFAQGYGIARPLPARDLPTWASDWRPDPRWANVSAIDPANFPLLYASVEHRAWLAALEEFLNGHRNTPPTMDQHLCRFGTWLDAEASAGRGGRPGFQAIDSLHQRVHAYANGLLDLKAHSEEEASFGGLNELYTLRDGMLEKLQYFVQSL
jgi:diguanylate cyclase (GGDEF)-like protein/PAS domain S-box-containing protein